jgi:hypothetical protein
MTNRNTDTVFELNRYLTISGATKPELFPWKVAQPRLDDDALFALA